MTGFRLNPGQDAANRLMGDPQRNTMLVGGSRSGKTFLIVKGIYTRAAKFPGSRHAILRFRSNAARQSISLDTLPKVQRLCFPRVPCFERRQEGYWELPNRSQIWVGGLDDKERVEKILGQEFATMFYNECSQIPYASVLLAQTRLAQVIPGLRQRAWYDLNPVGMGHWTYRLFVKKLEPMSQRPLTNPDQYAHMFLNPHQNAKNLTAEYLEALKNLPEKQRKRFLEGEYVPDIEGALWTYDGLEACRVEPEEVPQLTRIVVAVDPSGAAGKDDKKSDDIGIVAVGKGRDGHAYVLRDATLLAGPAAWGRAAVQTFHDLKADCIVAETNFGGEMVRFVIKTADPRVPFRKVVASRGKAVRAEPVSALYDQGLVHHVGRLPRLEDQLCSFATNGYIGEDSPDRADALVWALSDLMLGAPAEFDASGLQIDLDTFKRDNPAAPPS